LVRQTKQQKRLKRMVKLSNQF